MQSPSLEVRLDVSDVQRMFVCSREHQFRRNSWLFVRCGIDIHEPSIDVMQFKSKPIDARTL